MASTILFTIDISEDDDLSNALDISGYQLVALEIPSNFDGTTVTFTAAEVVDGVAGTFYPIYTAAGSLYTITTAASRRVQIPPHDLLGVKFLKLVTMAQTTTDTVIAGVVTRII